MFAWVGRRLRQDEGISLVEMLVSIVLLGLVLAALGNTLFTSMAAARQNEGMTQATAVANEQLEKLQAMPWAALDPASPPVIPPVVADGRTYTVTTQVAWVTAPQYKRYSVRLNWSENGQPHTLLVEGRRARRSGESTSVAPPNPFRVLVFTVNPDPVNLDATGKSLAATNPNLPGNAAMLLEVEMNEAARSDSVVVSWPIPSPTQTLTLTEVAGSGGTKFSGTIPSGQTYTPGWMTFRVTAAKASTATVCTASPQPAGGNCTETTSAAYLMAPIENGPLYHDDNPLRLYTGTPGPTGDRLCIANNGRLRNNNPIYLGLKGLGTDDMVTLVRTDVVPNISINLAWTNLGSYGWWWTGSATTGGSGVFTLGVNSTWEIRYIRTYDNHSSTIPLTFATLAASGNSAC